MNRPRSRHAALTHRLNRHRPPARQARPPLTKPMRWLTFVAAGSLAVVGTVLALHGGQQNEAQSSSGVPLLGSSVSNFAQLRHDTAEFGHMPVVRIYYPALPDANAWTSGLAATAGSAVVVSFKALPGTILSGRDDAALSHFFDSAPTGRPIYYSYFHEPEDNIAAGQFTLSAYKAAWAHVVAIADRAHNPDLHSTLILMAFDLRRYSHRDWKSYFPPGHIISTIGWDAYPDLGRVAEPPSQFMAPAVAAAKAAGLPFGFAEFGMSTANGRAAWLSEVGSYLMGSGALFGTLFNSPDVHPSMMVNDTGSISTWRRFVQASAAANRSGGGGGGDPSPSPSPRPSPPPSPHPSPSPSPHPSRGLAVTGLTLNPSRLTVGSGVHPTITFQLNQTADITICVLSGTGTVVRDIAQPGAHAGRVTVTYLRQGLDGHAGTYKVLVVASNASGSAYAEQTLTLVR